MFSSSRRTTWATRSTPPTAPSTAGTPPASSAPSSPRKREPQRSSSFRAPEGDPKQCRSAEEELGGCELVEERVRFGIVLCHTPSLGDLPVPDVEDVHVLVIDTVAVRCNQVRGAQHNRVVVVGEDV